MNTKGKGEKAQLVVVGELAKYDISCLYPLGDNLPFDFVAYKDGKLRKVQIKSSEVKGKSDAMLFDLRTTNWYRGTSKTYTNDDCDVIICYDHINDDCYVLFPEHFVGKGNFAVRRTKPKNSQKKFINLHEDFVLTKNQVDRIFT